MPFSSPGSAEAGAAFRYAPDMPRPLLAAILDSDIEKEGRTTAVVAECFTYTHEGAEIRVPASFITDFASIPMLARGTFPPFGRHAKAAVLHDWLYSVGEPGQKPFADRVFLAAMKDLNVSWWRRTAMYLAVVIGGGAGYRHAARDWATSFGDWRTGERCDPPRKREEYFGLKAPDKCVALLA